MHSKSNKDNRIILASSARTAAPNNVSLDTPCLGGVFVIDVTAVTATPSITITIKGVDPASGKKYTILASAAITSTGTTVLRIHPSLTASANAIAADVLPSSVEVSVAHGDTDSITYSIGFMGVN